MSEKSVGIESATLSEDPLLKNKKKTGFNLRKSIAWNNAFLTEDGAFYFLQHQLLIMGY